MRITRLATLAASSTLAALLVACSSPAPTPTTAMQTPPARLEYGRVTDIAPITTSGATSGQGRIFGAVAAPGQGTTTVLGGPGTAGSQAGSKAQMPRPMYRVTVQTEGGAMRYYDVPATGDLHVGDRVHVEHAVVYRVL